jgi:hypothetical protein
VAQAQLNSLTNDVRTEFKDVFKPLPHVDRLSPDILCKIKLKNANSKIASYSYSCPCEYRDAWKMLIQQHLDAGHIRLLSSPFASPTFIIPKTDPTVLLHWVNDYRQLNANMVTDLYPLPHIDNILADAGKGKFGAYWT